MYRFIGFSNIHVIDEFHKCSFSGVVRAKLFIKRGLRGNGRIDTGNSKNRQLFLSNLATIRSRGMERKLWVTLGREVVFFVLC